MRTTVHHTTYKAEIDKYLEEITYREPMRNEAGEVVKNLKGKKIWLYKYAVQPKVLDVLNRLDISSYHFYKKLKEDRELENVHTWFKDLIEAFLQESTLHSGSSSGARYQLAAYFGRSDKVEDATNNVTVKLSKEMADLAK